MAYIYILESEQRKKYYIGSTLDIKRRLKEHLAGKVHTTKRFLPIKLVFSQKCPNINAAREVELRLKRMKRRDYLEKIIKDGKLKILASISEPRSNSEFYVGGSPDAPHAEVGAPTSTERRSTWWV